MIQIIRGQNLDLDLKIDSGRFIAVEFCIKFISNILLMKTFKILILAVLLASCNTQVKQTESGTSAFADSENTSGTNCYLYAGLTDMVSLKMTHTGDTVTGNLVYNFKEKDKNTGTINGRMKGNILIAEYTFLSEGIQSCRQIAFKLDGDNLIEGYGESYSHNDKVLFRNTDSLTFNNSMKLVEISCL